MLANTLSVIVAVLHVGFFVLESILWTTPNVRRTFAMSEEQANATKVLALNQGAYNGALAVVLLWATFAGATTTAMSVLGLIVAVGIVGAVTVKMSILVLQALPAAAALAAMWLRL